MNMTPKIRFHKFGNDWEQLKFLDLAETRRGLTYNPANVRNAGIRVLRSSNIAEDQFAFGEEDVFVEPDAVNIPFANRGDILITSANGSARLVGKHAIIRDIPNNSAVHGGFMLLATAKNPEFVNALMSAPWYSRFISLYVAGGMGAIGNLNKSDLDEQDIIVPGDTEQKLIGKYFSQIDNLITFHQRKYTNLLSLKAACLDKMFPKYGSRVPELRFLSFSDDWNQYILSDLMTFQNGFNGSGDSFGNGTPLISVMDILDRGFITFSSIRGRANLNQDEMKRYSVEYGDVLFQRSSETFEDAGTSNVYLDTEKPAAFGGFVIRGKKKEKYDPVFMKYLLSTAFVRNQITRMAQGAQHINVSQDTLGDVLVYMPLPEEQESVGKVLFSLDNLIILHQHKTEKLQQLKQAMLHKMFV